MLHEASVASSFQEVKFSLSLLNFGENSPQFFQYPEESSVTQRPHTGS